MDKSCDTCGSSTTTITRFGDGSMCCGKCLRNGKKLSRASVDKYLAERGLVAVSLADCLDAANTMECRDAEEDAAMQRFADICEKAAKGES